MKSEEWVFVAGGFGFLGQYIVWGLVRRGYQVVIGASKRTDIDVKKRFNRFKDFNQLVNPDFRLHDSDFTSIHVVECDISKENLGLSHRDSSWPEKPFSQVWNCAAYMKYDPSAYQKSYETNVLGSLNLLKFAAAQAECTYYHVSTAYVGGKDFSSGRLLEERIYENKSGYFNSYDMTKACAEREIITFCQSHSKPPCAIFRPTIIIGDSKTGFTSSAYGFYEYLQALSRLKKHIKRETVHYPCDGLSLLHLIPVDRCAQTMLALTSKVLSHEIPIYTIADASPLTLETMTSILSEVFGFRLVCASTIPVDEKSYERLLRSLTKQNQIFSRHSFAFCSKQTYSLVGSSICSDWSKECNFFDLLNEELINFQNFQLKVCLLTKP